MKYICIKCNQEKERIEFNKFDDEMETGVCFDCEAPEYDKSYLEKKSKLGTPDQAKEADKQLEVLRRYKLLQQKKRKENEPERVKLSWSDFESIEGYLKSQKKKIKLDYEEAKKVFWTFYQDIVLEEKPHLELKDIQLSGNQPKIFKDFLQYLLLHDDGKCDVRKSMIIFGKKGVGKSTLVKAGERTMNYLKQKAGFVNPFRVEEMDMIMFDLLTKGDLTPLKKLVNGFICLDEVTEEHQVYKHFGNEIRLIDDIIRPRHLKWKSKNQNTIITTNLSPIAFGKIVNERTQDRMLQEYQIIEMSGENHRKK